jgi:hypothetical protein
MKMILAGVAFAALMGTSAFAHQLGKHEQPAARTYPNDQQVRVFRDRFLSAQPAPSRPMARVLCDTAHDFCPRFHGDNG